MRGDAILSHMYDPADSKLLLCTRALVMWPDCHGHMTLYVLPSRGGTHHLLAGLVEWAMQILITIVVWWWTLCFFRIFRVTGDWLCSSDPITRDFQSYTVVIRDRVPATEENRIVRHIFLRVNDYTLKSIVTWFIHSVHLIWYAMSASRAIFRVRTYSLPTYEWVSEWWFYVLSSSKAIFRVRTLHIVFILIQWVSEWWFYVLSSSKAIFRGRT